MIEKGKTILVMQILTISKKKTDNELLAIFI